MSVMAPHVRVLRAEADALERQSDQSNDAAGDAREPAQKASFLTIALILLRMAQAKRDAAGQLEDEDKRRSAALDRQPGDVEFKPKGKA